ncbi:MAG: SH3 domain-containing protein [Bacteroidota bacterium]
MTRFLFFLFFASAAGAAAQPLAPGYASAAQNLRLRATPSSSGHHVSSVPEGYPVQLGLCENGWCAVQYVGVRGFVPERHLSFRRAPLRPRTADAALTTTQPSENFSAEPIESLTLTPLEGQEAPEDFRETEDPEAQAAEEASVTAPAPAPLPPDDTPAEAQESNRVAEPVPEPVAAEEDLAAEAEPQAKPPEAAPPTELLTVVRPAPPSVIEEAPRLCPEQLAQARLRYRDRAFGETLDLISTCLNRGDPTPEEAVPAYRLLSLVYADTNEEAEAEQVLLRLLAVDPAYEPKRPYDPLHYVALVSSVRRDLGLPVAGYQCDSELAEAHGFYVTATFERAIQVAGACLSKPSLLGAEAVWAYRLVALSHLRQRNLAEARQAVLGIVALDPAYRADPIRDIPGYVALVDLVRQQNADGSP